ncbi:hypothetical protein [Picosynechococcus sp. PCC 7003]|uniref:hypothetical protein n=1 Tax=Picosynechococcus sp. PCC 7003 TaxID=374981 RepID=UPI0012ED3F9B|nr:hypothetical protein [Picosynechococcus sp. PCC 7003]
MLLDGTSLLIYQLRHGTLILLIVKPQGAIASEEDDKLQKATIDLVLYKRTAVANG